MAALTATAVANGNLGGIFLYTLGRRHTGRAVSGLVADDVAVKYAYGRSATQVVDVPTDFREPQGLPGFYALLISARPVLTAFQCRLLGSGPRANPLLGGNSRARQHLGVSRSADWAQYRAPRGA